jgi:hypothetical protein
MILEKQKRRHGTDPWYECEMAEVRKALHSTLTQISDKCWPECYYLCTLDDHVTLGITVDIRRPVCSYCPCPVQHALGLVSARSSTECLVEQENDRHEALRHRPRCPMPTFASTSESRLDGRGLAEPEGRCRCYNNYRHLKRRNGHIDQVQYDIDLDTTLLPNA